MNRYDRDLQHGAHDSPRVRADRPQPGRPLTAGPASVAVPAGAAAPNGRRGPAVPSGRGPASSQPAARPPRPLPRRVMIVLLTVMMLAFAALLLRQLYVIQVVDYSTYAAQAADQHYRKVAEIPRRGVIYDRNGVELAGTTYVYRVGMTPKDVRSITEDISIDTICDSVAAILEIDVAPIKKAIADDKAIAMAIDAAKEVATNNASDTTTVSDDGAAASGDEKTPKRIVYVQLAKDVTREKADALRTYMNEHTIGGIAIDSEPRRYYTNGALASQVIGFTHYTDGNLVGQLGIELAYNDILTGQPGYSYVETDNYRNKGQLPFSVPTSLRARNGQNLTLNLDINVQKIAQEELANAIAIYDITAGGSVIIMDPFSGGILAMASYPFFSSEDPTACPPGKSTAAWQKSGPDIEYLSSQVWRNRSISDTYEPGSTFKSLTAAIALEEGLARENEIFSDRTFKVLTQPIHCAHRPDHGLETLTQAFWNSCNPIFAQLSLRTGIDRFYTYVRAFGFRDVTGIDLPAEGRGILHRESTSLDMATLSYGESSTVTALQLATAYCTFANGGNLIRPSVVRATTDDTGAIIREYQPETIRKVISETTAIRVRELMKGVVLYGTGTEAYVEGYAIAGKTSTSTDDNGDHTISFASVAPADSPRIVTLVVLAKPRDKNMTSKYAARTCGQIVARTLDYLGTTREYSDHDVSRLQEKVTVPNVKGLTMVEARKILGSLGFRIEVSDPAMGDKTVIRDQSPDAGTRLHNKGLIFLYPRKTSKDLVAIPDFTGKTVNECQNSAAESGLNIIIDGSCLGVAVSQDPLPTYGSETAGSAATAAADDPADDPADETAAGSADNRTTEKTPAASPKIRRLPRGSIVTIKFAPVEESDYEPAVDP